MHLWFWAILWPMMAAAAVGLTWLPRYRGWIAGGTVVLATTLGVVGRRT